MTTVETAYERYLQKVEKNITNDNISTDRGRFVMLFNESQNKFQELVLQNRGSDDVRYIQNLLILDKKISNSKKAFDHYDFEIPENYFDLADVRALASKEDCENQLIELFEMQSENINSILSDEFNKPSFKWREAPYTLNSNKVSVYVGDDDFKIDSLLMDYYRYANQISLINPENPESKFNELIKIEWDDKALDRILSICAGEFDMNENNPRFQIQNLRTQK